MRRRSIGPSNFEVRNGADHNCSEQAEHPLPRSAIPIRAFRTAHFALHAIPFGLEPTVMVVRIAEDATSMTETVPAIWFDT